MAYIDLKLNSKGEATGFTVKTTFSEKGAMNTLNAAWSAKNQHWTLPLDVDIRLLDKLTKLEMSPLVTSHIEKRYWKLHFMKKNKALADAPTTFQTDLDAYQRVGAHYLFEAEKAILADDVGLGKTAQAILAFRATYLARALVITRKTLLTQWQDQITLWHPEAESSIYTDKNYDSLADYTLVNYETLFSKKGEGLFARFWSVVIADEAHNTKNRKAKRTAAFHKLAHQAHYLWLLTATPTPNGPWELWSLLHAIDPQYYSSYWRFVERHCNTQQVFGGTAFLPGLKDPARFEEEVGPYILRRDKALLNLPPVSYETIPVKMSPTQAKLYKALAEDFIGQVSEDTYVTASTVLAQLTRLRQVLCTPALIGGKDDSAKTEALLELVEDLAPTHKILVFTAFAGYASNLTQKLTAYAPKVIIGEQSAKERSEATSAFSDDSACRVLVGTIGAMGEGLNLQAASVVIFTDLDWTPARNDIQAVGRAHRRGQDKPVHVITLTTKGTVEEHVQEILDQKQNTITLINTLVGLLKGGSV